MPYRGCPLLLLLLSVIVTFRNWKNRKEEEEEEQVGKNPDGQKNVDYPQTGHLFLRIYFKIRKYFV